METKTPLIIKILTYVVGGITALTAIPKFLAAPGNEFYANFEQLGIAEVALFLGIIDVLLAAVYLFPRTSTLGTIAMFGYWSGALATELSHGGPQPVSLVLIVLTIVVAWFRSPELFDKFLRR